MEQKPAGREVIVGATEAPGLGSLVMFGLGGIFVEVMKDVVFGVAPVSSPEAREMMRGDQGQAMLDGVRGDDRVDLAGAGGPAGAGLAPGGRLPEHRGDGPQPDLRLSRGHAPGGGGRADQGPLAAQPRGGRSNPMTHWVPAPCPGLRGGALRRHLVGAAVELVRQGIVGYLLAGRGLPSYVSAALLAGLAVGGASTIGVAERAYSVGLSAGWYNAAWAAGAFVHGALRGQALPPLARSPRSPSCSSGTTASAARVLGVVGQLVMQVVVTSLQYVAGGAILHSLMPGLPGLESLGLTSFHTGMLITAVVFVGITLIGGFWAAGLTNVVNVLVIYVGIVLGAVLTVGRLGGLGVLTARLPTGHGGFDLAAVGPGIIAAWFIVMITQVHSTQSVIQIGFATKDEKSAARGYLLGGAIILPVGFISAIIGMAAAVLHPGIVPAKALPAVVLELPPLAAGVILAGLWAADVSTASALLMGSATLVCGDLIKRFIAPTMSASREQLVCRLTVAGLSVVTFLLALTVTGIFKFLLVGLTLSTAYTLVVLATIYAPGICRKGSAFWTLLMTMLALGVWLLMPGPWRFLPHPIYFTWIVSLVTFAAVALVDRRKIDLTSL